MKVAVCAAVALSKQFKGGGGGVQGQPCSTPRVQGPGGQQRLRTCKPGSLLALQSSFPRHEAVDGGLRFRLAAGPGLRPCGAEPAPLSARRARRVPRSAQPHAAFPCPALRRERGPRPAALLRGPADRYRGPFAAGGRGRGAAGAAGAGAGSGAAGLPSRCLRRGRGCRGVPARQPRRYLTTFPPFVPARGWGVPEGTRRAQWHRAGLLSPGKWAKTSPDDHLSYALL